MINNRESGFSLMEVIVAMTILLFVGFAVMSSFQSLKMSSVSNQDKIFASQKVIQMMEELRSVAVAASTNLTQLDKYADGGGVKNKVLTTLAGVKPEDNLSGNAGGRYYRQIVIAKIPSDVRSRRVEVRVFLTQTDEVLSEGISVLKSLASQDIPNQVFDLYVLNISNSQSSWERPGALADFNNFILDLNIRNPGLEIRPHVITRLAYGRDPYYSPFINNNHTADDPLLVNNPVLGVYWYPGRLDANNAYYDSNIFPGRHLKERFPIPAPNTDPYQELVPPNPISGPDYVAGVGVSPLTLEQGGSVADQFNHAVRYPDEDRLFLAATNRADFLKIPRPEPSLMMILNQLNIQPNAYRNAIFVNLHGNTLPLPPMRNYSDPAKDPVLFPNVRVVTHPERIWYDSNDTADYNDRVRLRVYSYVTNPDDPFWGINHDDDFISPISIVLSNADNELIPANRITISKYSGDSGTAYTFGGADDADIAGGADDFRVRVNFPSPGKTTITLYNSHLFTPKNLLTKGGLRIADRLYGLEYIPCTLNPYNANSPGRDFLAFSPGNGGLTINNPNDNPKNTARWEIRLNVSGLSNNGRKMYTIETRIGDVVADPGNIGLNTGVAGNKPENLSRTYVWVGVQPPFTEQFQFMGDPRYMPYADIKAAGGYNRYFLSGGLNGNGNWPGFNLAEKHWSFDGANTKTKLNIDLPAFFRVFRNGIIGSHAIWSQFKDLPFEYVSLGGDIPSMRFTAYNLQQLPWRPGMGVGTIKVFEMAHDDVSVALTGTRDFPPDPITGIVPPRPVINPAIPADERNLRLIARAAPFWWSNIWLGELYPDDVFSVGPNNPNEMNDWKETGNLPVGPGNFVRAAYSNLTGGPVTALNLDNDAANNRLTLHPRDRTLTSFFNGGIAYDIDSINARIDWGVAPFDGTQMGNQFKYALPIQFTQPVNYGPNVLPPLEFNNNPYNDRTTINRINCFYMPNPPGSQVMSVANYRFQIGNNADVDAGLMFLGAETSFAMDNRDRYRILVPGLIYSFMEMGMPNGGVLPAQPPVSRFSQLPRVSLQTPLGSVDITDTDINKVRITWDAFWSNWEGNKYTLNWPNWVNGAPAVNFPNDPIAFQILYTMDNGRNWHYIQDPPNAAPARLGERTGTKDVVPIPANLPVLTFDWDLTVAADVNNPVKYPSGSYILRLECFNLLHPNQHYSYNTRHIQIKR